MTPPRIATLLSVLIPLAGCATQENIGSLLADYHYVEVRPPTTLWPPGSIVVITNRDPLVLGVVCPTDAFLGPVRPNVSSSTNNELARKATNTFKVDARYLDQLKASGKYTSITNVNLKFSNVKVLELDRTKIFENLSKRTEGCSKAIKDALDNHEDISLVISVLQADVAIKAEFSSDANLSLQAKNNMLQDLATEIGAQSTTSGSDTDEGNSLYWGIRDNQRFALLDTNGNVVKTIDKDSVIKHAAMAASKKSNGILVAYSSKPTITANDDRRIYAKHGESWLSSVFGTTGTPDDFSVANRDPDQFIIANADNLAMDISRGDGEYVRSLATILKVGKDDQRLFIEEMRRQMFQSDVPIERQNVEAH